MNGKKAKLMRQVGKGLTKRDKKLYNMLNSFEKGILGDMYKALIENNSDVLKKQSRQQRIEDPAKLGSGEVFVYDMDGNLEYRIRPSDDPYDEDSDAMGCGDAVGISSDRIIVGARYYTGNPGGVAGRAYLFDHLGKELQAGFPNQSFDSDFGSSQIKSVDVEEADTLVSSILTMSIEEKIVADEEHPLNLRLAEISDDIIVTSFHFNQGQKLNNW